MKKILLRASLAVLLPTTSLLAVDSGLVRLLEVTATYGNTSKQEPETIGSILSSVLQTVSRPIYRNSLPRRIKPEASGIIRASGTARRQFGFWGINFGVVTKL
jgi:hypothetical protein